jgi:hypothetical protein
VAQADSGLLSCLSAVLAVVFIFGMAMWKRRRARMYNQSFLPGGGNHTQPIPMTNDYHGQPPYGQQPYGPGAAPWQYGQGQYDPQQYNNSGAGYDATNATHNGVNYPPKSYAPDAPGNGTNVRSLSPCL